MATILPGFLFVATLLLANPERSFTHLDKNQVLPTLSRKLRYALFPDTSTMGIYLAIALPLDATNYDVSMSWNFEANYALPSNYTELVTPFVAGRAARSLDRRRVYEILEGGLESHGLEGQECLLRAICEASETPLGHDGLLGDLLHIIFTPSSSMSEGLPEAFNLAEQRGASGANCRILYPKCPLGIFDVMTVLETEPFYE